MEGEKGPQGGEADLALAVSPNYPVARVKRIIRSDPEIKLVSADALYLITKATVRRSWVGARFSDSRTPSSPLPVPFRSRHLPPWRH